MLREQHRTERMIVVAIAIVVAKIEHSRTSTIVVIASTIEDRIVRVREISAYSLIPIYF